MTFFRQATGKKGEDEAAKYLKKIGMRIICRNYRCKLGELDIVAEDHGVLVFVEVRSRRTKGYGLPQETIGLKKRAQVRKVAQYYLLKENLINRDCRFDVLAMQLDGSGKLTNVEYFKNAF